MSLKATIIYPVAKAKYLTIIFDTFPSSWTCQTKPYLNLLHVFQIYPLLSISSTTTAYHDTFIFCVDDF